MDLQTVFYTLGIIFYIFSILILLGIGIGVFFMYRKINQIYQEIDKKIDMFRTHPQEVAAGFGSAIAATAFKKVGEFMTTNKKHKR